MCILKTFSRGDLPYRHRSVALLVLPLILGHKLLNLSLKEHLMQETVYIIELCEAPSLLHPTFPANQPHMLEIVAHKS